ncbi:MAG: alpha-1,2-fucosyltransferase [Nostoc sp. TH1S01]|nr:alpha-1,2-fucosyltransferase [Nostoc sp. TH1S01]
MKSFATNLIRDLTKIIKFKKTQFVNNSVRFYWRLMGISPSTNLVGLTYANERFTDGAGAQIQRIYGIYAVSRFLNVPYIHSALAKLDYQGLIALEQNTVNQDIVNEYNKIFKIPSDIELPVDYCTDYIHNLDLLIFEKLRRKAIKNQTFILAKVLLTYNITDIYPETLQYVKDVSPFSLQQSSVIRIAIHVRRGDLLFVASQRMLSNQYYISVAQKISAILDRFKLDYVFELHTELPTQSFTVTPNQHSMLKSTVVVDSKSTQLAEFDVIPNLEKFVNADPIETLQRMSSANVLVMSHSSFSYLSAILNAKGVIIYHKFWHSPLKNWLITNNAGDFSPEEFIQQLQKNSAVTQQISSLVE